MGPESRSREGYLSLVPSCRELIVGEVLAAAGNAIGKVVRFDVVLTGNAGDREFQGSGQLATDPMQRIEPRTPASIFAGHLAHDYLRIRINPKRKGASSRGTLKRFHERHVFGHVVVLPTNPLSDLDPASGRIFDNHPDTGRTRAAMRTSVYVGHQMTHVVFSVPSQHHAGRE